MCLSLTGEEWRTLIEDNVDLLEGLFRTFCCGNGWQPDRIVLKARHGAGKETFPSSELKPIDKVLTLRNIPVFQDVQAQEMVNLASIANEIRLSEGSVLFTESDSPSIYALISGEIVLSASGSRSELLAEFGDVIGVYETLAGLPLGSSASVKREGTALRIEREDLFDLLANRPELLQQIFGALFRGRSGGSRIGQSGKE